MRAFIMIILLSFIVITGCEQGDTRKNKSSSNELQTSNGNLEDDQLNIIENETGIPLSETELLNQFYGVWTNKDDQNYILELQEGVELVGLIEGDIMSSSEITIEEINANEQSIILYGTTKYYDDDSEKEKFKSKLYLKNDGKELIYINDFLGEMFESKWMRQR